MRAPQAYDGRRPDAGLGMLQALGFRFFDKEGHEVGSMEKGIALCGALLSEISSIDSSSAHPALKKACFTTACDVRNPFFGPNGAAHVFAPQKGADADMVKELDIAMQHLSDVIFHTTGKDVSFIPVPVRQAVWGAVSTHFWMHS